MDYALLVRKLNILEKKYFTSKEIKEYCDILHIKYYDAISYLTRNKHLYTLLRGIFYKPSIEERKLGKISVTHIEAISEALRIKGVNNWYFGLESALKMNNTTHEFFNIDTIINDKIFRKTPLTILGNKIKFIKIKKKLLSFGIRNSGIIRYSDIEKTVLDIIYLSKYNGLNPEEIKNKIASFIILCSKNKLLEYSKKYNTTTKKFIEPLV